MFVHVIDFKKCLPHLQPSVALRAFPRMTAAQVTFLNDPWNASHPHPVSIFLPLVPTKDAVFPGAGSLDRGLGVQHTAVVANISHILPSHTGEASTVCTAN